MQIVGRIVPHRLEVEPFHDVQHLERDQALRVGGHLVNCVPSICRRYGIDPAGIEFFEVSEGEKPTEFFRSTDDPGGDLALVESITPGGRYLAEDSGKIRRTEYLSVSRRDTVPQIRSRGSFIEKQQFFRGSPLAGDDLGYGKTNGGIFDRGFEKPRHRKLPVTAMELEPACDCAGHGDGLNAFELVNTTCIDVFQVCLSPRPAAAVQSNRPSHLQP